MFDEIGASSADLLSIGIVLTLWSASGAVMTLINAVNRAYGLHGEAILVPEAAHGGGHGHRRRDPHTRRDPSLGVRVVDRRSDRHRGGV